MDCSTVVGNGGGNKDQVRSGQVWNEGQGVTYDMPFVDSVQPGFHLVVVVLFLEGGRPRLLGTRENDGKAVKNGKVDFPSFVR